MSYDEYDDARPLPQSIEAEQAVLGGLMLAPTALANVADWLKPEDFIRWDHRQIYTAILELAEKNKPFDPVTMGEWFEAQGQSDVVGHGAYLIQISAATPSAANITAYAEIVKDKAALREGIQIGTKLVESCYRPEGKDTIEIVADASRALVELKGDPKAGGLVAASSGLNDWFNDLQERYNSGNKLTGIPYPWKDVNDVTHGLQPGELTIVAARPSMGKSIMGLNLAMFSALRELHTAVFSLEMTQRQINRRNISSLSGVPHEWLLAPDKEHEEYWSRVTSAIQRLRSAPLMVDDQAGVRTEQIVARARRAHMKRPIKLLVLDHMHDVALPGKKEARHEIGDIAAAGKMLAKEFDCPAVFLAQLNRSCESRTDKRPVMADLRESGDIEQKADAIWFLYREDYYQRNKPGYEPLHDVELILGKGRDLRVGAPVILREQFDVMALRDWEGPRPVRNLAAPEPKRGMF
jgi:replicative DNA helicase